MPTIKIIQNNEKKANTLPPGHCEINKSTTVIYSLSCIFPADLSIPV